MSHLCTDSSDAFLYLRHGLWRIDLALWRHYSMGRANRIATRQRPRANEHPSIDFTYGETGWAAMRRILHLTQARPGTRFLDLGSGTGRFAMFASKLGLRARGVELVRPFVSQGNRLADRLGLACDFVAEDIFHHPWGEADIVYVVATAFSAESVQALSQKCNELAPGARIAVTTYGLESPELELESTEVLDFSWAPSAVFVYRKA